MGGEERVVENIVAFGLELGHSHVKRNFEGEMVRGNVVDN